MPNKCPTSHFYVPFYATNLSSCLSSSVQSSAYICSSITLFNPRFMIPSNDFASTTARPLLMSMLKSNLHTVFKKSMISSGCLKVMFIVLILFTSFCLNGYEILFIFHLYHSTFFLFKRVKFFIKEYFFNQIYHLFSTFSYKQHEITLDYEIPLELRLYSVGKIPSSSLNTLLIYLGSE